jgi:hypothetical protein
VLPLLLLLLRLAVMLRCYRPLLALLQLLLILTVCVSSGRRHHVLALLTRCTRGERTPTRPAYDTTVCLARRDLCYRVGSSVTSRSEPSSSVTGAALLACAGAAGGSLAAGSSPCSVRPGDDLTSAALLACAGAAGGSLAAGSSPCFLRPGDDLTSAALLACAGAAGGSLAAGSSPCFLRPGDDLNGAALLACAGAAGGS